jgi:hypothetical protein
VSDDEAPPKQDVVFMHSALEDGEGFRVLRQRDDALEVGELRAVQEGRPLHGEMVRLSPREGSDRVFDVEVLVSRKETAPRSGPAQIATAAYRANWETIFRAHDTDGDPDLPN